MISRQNGGSASFKSYIGLGLGLGLGNVQHGHNLQRTNESHPSKR